MSCTIFECHVTYLPKEREKVLQRAREVGFWASYMTGDEDLNGDLSNARLLQCIKKGTELKKLEIDAAALINYLDVPPLRYKIVVVIIDNIIDRKRNELMEKENVADEKLEFRASN